LEEKQVFALAEAEGATDVVFDPASGGSVGDGYDCEVTDGG
jgi:hypothetical protein